MRDRSRSSAGGACVVGARRASGAGSGSRSPWWRRIGCAARSSPGAWRTSGRSALTPPADHEACRVRTGRSRTVRAVSGTHSGMRRRSTASWWRRTRISISLARVGVGAQHDPAQELGEHLVDQPQRHQRIMPGTWRGRTSRSRAVRTVSGTRNGNEVEKPIEDHVEHARRHGHDHGLQLEHADLAGHGLRPTSGTPQSGRGDARVPPA